MSEELERHSNLTLRLPLSLSERASKCAQHEGVSFNHFVLVALTEKLTRMEANAMSGEERH
jgi:predicted HicB family RNase H-like nuclease